MQHAFSNRALELLYASRAWLPKLPAKRRASEAVASGGAAGLGSGLGGCAHAVVVLNTKQMNEQ